MSIGHFDFPVVSRDSKAEDLVNAAKSLIPALAEGASARDLQRRLPHEEMEWVRKAGITAARVPQAWNGPELAYSELAKVMIALAEGEPNIAQALIPHFTSVGRLRLNGSPAQHERYFAGLRHGDIISGATGELGGKFVTDMTTRIINSENGLRLRGKKFYSTGGLLADRLRVTAKDETGNTVSVLIPRQRAGIVQHDDWDGMGQRLTASGTTEFNDVLVHRDEVMFYSNVLNKRRNYQPAATQMLHSTIEVGITFAVLKDAIDWAHRGARPRAESGVERSTDDWYVQHIVGNIAAHAHAAEATLLRAALHVDRAVDAWYGNLSEEAREEALIAASIATAEAKIICNEVALKAAELIYDIGGSSATLRTNNFDRHWRNARTHTTHDPINHRYRVVGRHWLDQTPPPIPMYA